MKNNVRYGNDFFFVWISIPFMIFIGLVSYKARNHAKQYTVYNNIERAAVKADCTATPSKYEGKIVYTVGNVAANGLIYDDTFDATSDDVVVFSKVEYYQEKKGKRRYRRHTRFYYEDWDEGSNGLSSSIIKEYFIDPYAYASERATVNNFKLDAASLLSLHEKDAKKAVIDKDLGSTFAKKHSLKRAIRDGNVLHFYREGSPEKPEIGGMRVTFTCLPDNCEISVIGKVKKGAIYPLTTQDDGPYAIIRPGKVTLHEMVKDDYSLEDVDPFFLTEYDKPWDVIVVYLLLALQCLVFGIVLFIMLTPIRKEIEEHTPQVRLEKLWTPVWIAAIIAAVVAGIAIPWLYYNHAIGLKILGIAAAITAVDILYYLYGKTCFMPPLKQRDDAMTEEGKELARMFAEPGQQPD